MEVPDRDSSRILLATCSFLSSYYALRVRNNHRVRRAMGDVFYIGFVEHTFWVLKNRDHVRKYWFQILFGELRVGYIRLMRTAKHSAEVSIALEPEFWGRGISHQALLQLLRLPQVRQEFHALVATVDSQNSRSHRLFSSLGFKDCGITENHNRRKLIFVFGDHL